MTRSGRSDLSPLERAAGVFTPSQRKREREREINRERTERKRVCAQRKSVGDGWGGLVVCWRFGRVEEGGL